MVYDGMRPAPAGGPSAHPRHRPILGTAFTHRALGNWQPLFRRLNEDGHPVYTALFPHISDPDHVGLFDIDFPNVVTCRIGRDFQTCDKSEEEGLSEVAAWVSAMRPDFVLTC